MLADECAVEVVHVERTFGGGRRIWGGRAPAVHAVRGVSFHVMRHETLSIVGESGSGKSTLARILVGLDHATSGIVALDGDRALTAGRNTIQYVFQDSAAALNPRKTVAQTLHTTLRVLFGLSPKARAARAVELMGLVSLDESFLPRYPHELSGGQAQRVGIARAIAAEPQTLVLDEPVSGLDVSMQAQVLAMLAALKSRLGLTYVFISHDLAVVEAVSDRVLVLYFGKVVEMGPVRQVFSAPRHHYTSLLLRSAPRPLGPPRVDVRDDAELPDPYAPPKGCAFAARCPAAQPICRDEDPVLTSAGGDPGHQAACHFPKPTGA